MKKNPDQHCQNCHIDFPYRGKGAKYCSLKCSAESRWKATKAIIESNVLVFYETLKKYLLERDPRCSECEQGETWNGKPLTLQIDHIDGDSDNTRLSNCRLLCPNCHTQTETYGAKGMGSRYKKTTARNKYLQEYKTKPE